MLQCDERHVLFRTPGGEGLGSYMGTKESLYDRFDKRGACVNASSASCALHNSAQVNLGRAETVGVVVEPTYVQSSCWSGVGVVVRRRVIMLLLFRREERRSRSVERLVVDLD
jgi:hypothetical protein